MDGIKTIEAVYKIINEITDELSRKSQDNKQKTNTVVELEKYIEQILNE